MKTSLERLAELLEMPAEHVREAARNIAQENMKKRLLEKVRIIRSGNTAITPTGEIVERGTPGSMNYESGEERKQGMSMDKELQIIEISQLMGWTDLKLTITGPGGGTRFPTAHGIPPKRGYLVPCPRYTDCLNACAEMEKAIILPLEGPDYYHELEKIIERDRSVNLRGNAKLGFSGWLTHATAPQRCEAALKTLNLWTPTGEENE